MQLTLWTYEGPPHIGAMRVATAMTDVHYVMHAPQGDTYADLLFTMIERLPRRPPVTYTTSKRATSVATRQSCSKPPSKTPTTVLRPRPCWSERRVPPS